jgi:hypothetical protein
MIAKDAQKPVFPEIVDVSKVLVFHSKIRVAKENVGRTQESTASKQPTGN